MWQKALNRTGIFISYQLDVEKRKAVHDIIRDARPTDGPQLCGARFILSWAPTRPSTAIPVFPLALQLARRVCIHARAHPESAGAAAEKSLTLDSARPATCVCVDTHTGCICEFMTSG